MSDADSLLAREERQRRSTYRIDDRRKLHILAPTPGDLERWIQQPNFQGELIPRCVVGWEGFETQDLVGTDGSDEKVAFSPALFRRWLDKNPRAKRALIPVIEQACEGAAKELVEAQEKPEPSPQTPG